MISHSLNLEVQQENIASKLRNLKTAMTAHLIERFFLCAVCACEKNEEFMARKIFSFFIV